MFTDKLFDHKYDIDDIIFAFMQTNHSERILLNTTNGEMTFEKGADTRTKDIQDGDNNNHWHVITPLPNVFFQNITQGLEFKKLQADVKAQIIEILQHTKTADLPTRFNESYAASWIREQVKAAAIEWLEMKNMIPPSMRHVRDIPALSAASPLNAATPQAPLSVKIEID